MADTDLTATGKSTTVQLIVNGSPVQIIDKVTSFSAKPDTTEVRSKYIGGSGSSIAQEFDGWSGKIGLELSTSAFDDAANLVMGASIARTPLVINVVDTTYWSDGSSTTHTYPDVKLSGWEKAVKRGEATTGSLDWATGSNRISV